jgi:hypothetical protein
MDAFSFQPGGAESSACSFSLAAGLAAGLAGASPRHLAGRTRRGAVALARAQAFYLGHVGLGVPLSHAAAALGRDRASARRACARIEARREAPGADHALTCLEAGLRAFRSSLTQDEGARS